jgi:hypothetical protein
VKCTYECAQFVQQVRAFGISEADVHHNHTLLRTLTNDQNAMNERHMMMINWLHLRKDRDYSLLCEANTTPSSDPVPEVASTLQLDYFLLYTRWSKFATQV